MRTHIFLSYLAAVACHAALETQGPWIVNSTNGRRVQLRCVNWYGAHQELYVVGGLEVRGVGELVDTIVGIGANCVRIPFSVELTKHNPVVTPSSVQGVRAGECNSTERAMDVMDCVVHHLKERNLLLFFNSHTSWAGWVGNSAVEQQGLWNLPGYPTMDWIRSMEHIVSRYEIAGMELRNEIHDQDGRVITWGESHDVDTDWLAASSLASERLHQVDPSILIVVGGLCWNLDLRSMIKKVGSLPAFLRGKLVYSAHVYSFSFWWRMEERMLDMVNLASVLLSVISLMLSVLLWFKYSANQKRFEKGGDFYKQLDGCDKAASCDTAMWISFASSTFVFFVGWLILAVLFSEKSKQGGCSTLADDAHWLVGLSSVMIVVTGLLALCYWRVLVSNGFIPFFFLSLSFFFLSLFVTTVYLKSDGAMVDFLGVWSLNNRPVPVFVTELGVSDPDYHVWRVIRDYVIGKYDLDFAYWAFNGRKWTRGGVWVDETFGLVKEDYKTWRHPALIRDLFSLKR